MNPLAVCIKCHRVDLTTPSCPHEPGLWIRMAGPERLGVCRHCPPFWAKHWDAAELTGEEVGAALEKLPKQTDAPKLEPDKIAERINVRILWFSLNNRMETP